MRGEKFAAERFESRKQSPVACYGGVQTRMRDPVSMPSAGEASLRHRVLKAGAWSFAGYGLNQAIRFGSNLLLTRLLAPEAFGVMAIAFLVLTCLAMFSDLGLNINVVQSPRGRNQTFLNTVWAIQVVRGLVLWFVALGVSLTLFLARHTDLAGPAGFIPQDSVYADPRLPYVIAAVSITAVLAGVQSTRVFEARRNLALGRITRIEIVAQLVGLLCMVAWLAFDRSVWALVAGTVASALVTTLLSHIWLPGVANRWEWDRSAFDEVIRFGKWIFLSSITGFLVGNGDRFLLAGLIGATSFGVYVIAFLVYSTIDQVLGRLITDVSFPALSEIARERRADLKTGYYRFYVALAAFAYFTSGCLMVSGQALISLLYDPRYQDAGWMLQILATALLTIPSRLAAQCFLVLGVSKIFSHIQATRLVVLYVCLPVGLYFFGLAGALWGIVLAHFSTLPVVTTYMVKNGLYDLRKEIALLPIAVLGAVSGLAIVHVIDLVRALPFVLGQIR
jgi:O-antigen/teichoic acid export membrane protein